MINQACIEHQRTVVFAGVYERGEGGDVCIIYPDEGPCYACWAEHLREGLSDSVPDEELDYGMIGPDGTLAAEPGLWLHVVRIAATQADLALNLPAGRYAGPPQNARQHGCDRQHVPGNLRGADRAAVRAEWI